ncbi:hypothetical protein [uncultured Arthrobacter sp.]|uniref:hypothetical protein n=1 Tax=uncultured Arthrobacter sp. TaxID=114050 RepID=UPI003216B514
MNLPSTGTSVEWDERNAVEIHRYASTSQIDHSVAEAYEFVVSPASGGHLDITALYAPRQSKTLIVSFHGSLQRSKYQLPRFEWRNSLALFDAAQLFIADSTLNLNGAMALAWYVGDSGQDFSADVTSLIQDIAAAAGYERVLLAGSSGGGFAALAISRRIAGSVAVCFSPQTRIGDYHEAVVEKFRSVAFGEAPSYAQAEIEHRARFDLRHLYETTPDVNYVRYVQNTRDPDHYVKHYVPFAEALGIAPADGGYDATGRIELVPQRLQPGHQPPSRGRFRSHILAAHSAFFGVELAVQPD